MKSFKNSRRLGGGGMGGLKVVGERGGAGLARGRAVGRPCCASRPLPPRDLSSVRPSLTAQVFTTQEDPPLQDLTLKEFAAVFKNKPENKASVCTKKDNPIPFQTTTVFPSLLRSQLKWNPFIAYAPPCDDWAEPRIEECYDDIDEYDEDFPYPSSVLKKTLFRDSGVCYNNQATMTSNGTWCERCSGVNHNLARNKMGRLDVCQSWLCMPSQRRRRKKTKPLEPAYVDYCSQNSYEDIASIATGVSNSGKSKSLSRDYSFPYHLLEDLPEEDWLNIDPSEKRRTLYNEGISDEIAFNPFYNQKIRADWQPPPPSRCCTDYMMNSWIPHSHRGNSKYHRNCSRLSPPDPVVASFARCNSCMSSVPAPHCSPRMPRKIFASEKTGCFPRDDFRYHPRYILSADY